MSLEAKDSQDLTPLDSFVTKKRTALTKPQLRWKVIKAHREITVRKPSLQGPCLPLNYLNIENPAALDLWVQVNKLCSFLEYSKLETVDDDFCFAYFSNQNFMQNYILYVKFLFTEPDTDILCAKFGLYCCFENVHSDSCQSKWRALEQYLKEDLF